MRKIANFILGTIVCLTVLGIIMFLTLYISLIIANENPPSDDAMFRMIQKTYELMLHNILRMYYINHMIQISARIIGLCF